MFRLVQEVRFAARTLVRSRFVTSLAVLAFALGIGVTSAVFSIFNGVLLKPLPFPEPQDLVVVYDTQPACATCPASYPKYMDWKTRNTVFEAIGGSAQVAYTLTGAGDPSRVQGVATTASLVDVFGVPPALGRWYTEQEAQFGGPLVVVLSHDLWTRQFNADPTVVGRRLTFDGKTYEVIGVMPPTFAYRRAQFYVPLQRTLDPATRGNHFMPTYARLKKGVTLDRATAEMRALGHTLAAEFGNNHGVDVRSYYEVLVGSVRRSLWMLMGAVVLVLLIACANVANLLLAAGMARRREFAIRMALGAGRGALARQLATESLLLAAIGGALGILLARWMVSVFVVLAGNQLPRATTIEIDGRVLAFAAVTTLVVGVVCGVWPLLRLRQRDLTGAVREGDTRTSSAGGRHLGNGLVVAEIAIAFALLVGAGLLVKNLMLLSARDAGMRTDRIVSFNVAPAGPRYQAPEQVVAFYHELYSRLTAIDSIESAGMTSHLPMVDFGWNGEFQIEGNTPWSANEAPLVEYRWIHGEYLKTLAVPLLKGRTLDTRDGKGSNTVLINQAMADKFWPGQDPIGKRFGQGNDRSQWYRSRGRDRQHPLAGADAQQSLRVLPDHRSSVVRFDGRGRPDSRGRSDCGRACRAADRRVDRSLATDYPGADDGRSGRGVGWTAAADVGVDGGLRRACRAAGHDRGVWRDVVQRPPAAPGVRHPPGARRGRVERPQPGRRPWSRARGDRHRHRRRRRLAAWRSRGGITQRRQAHRSGRVRGDDRGRPGSRDARVVPAGTHRVARGSHGGAAGFVSGKLPASRFPLPASA